MAADIGVKIGVQGDEQYKQSLKDIIQETKTLNAEMKATESAFDKNLRRKTRQIFIVGIYQHISFI